VALSCGLALAACGSSSTTVAHTTAPPVTQPAPATTTATVTVTHTATVPASTTGTAPSTASGTACTARDLAPVFLGENSATGTTVLVFALRDTGAAACHTYGYPGVLFLGKGGAALPTDATRTTHDLLGSTTVSAITLSPGQEASFRVVARATATGGGSCPTVAALQVIAPDDTATMRVTIPNGAVACATATVSALQPGTGAQPGV
jgi:hypothetical protein